MKGREGWGLGSEGVGLACEGVGFAADLNPVSIATRDGDGFAINGGGSGCVRRDGWDG